MNLNKADRKVFLPPREKTSRTRVPKKKQDELQDEVRWVGPCIARHSARGSVVAIGATGWHSHEGRAWAGSLGPGLGQPPCAALYDCALRHAPCVAAACLQDLEEEGTVLERKQKAAEKKLREGAHPELPGVLGRPSTSAAGASCRVRAHASFGARGQRWELRELCHTAGS